MCCKEENTGKMVQTIGPLHADAREGEFKNLKEGNYLVYLEVYVYGSDSVIRSEVMSMQPALSPDPPQITVTLVGLEDRRQVEKFTCDLVNKRDRLIRQVGHKLRKIGALTHPLRAEKNEDIVNGAVYLSHIEELLENCFSALDNYTGQLTALVSWQCPQSHEDIQVSGYKLLLDGKQYGSPMHAGIRTIKVQLGLEQPSYRLSMVATSDKPKGVSCESNTVEVLTMPFKPFTFYCYHKIHRKDMKYPAYGCCKYQDSIQYERQSAKKLANQGLLQKQIPPPACSVLDIFDGEFKPLMSSHSPRCPTAVLFWTPWCLSSQKMMDHFIRFAKDNTKEMMYIAVACGLTGTAAESRKTLAHTITANSWREDQTVWHVTADCASNVYETMNSINRTITGKKIEQDKVTEKLMDLTEVLGIAGVPTLLFMSPEGHIAWHGRYCAFDYSAFESFMRHVVSEVLKQPCPVFNCDSCKNDTTVDEDAVGKLLKETASSQNAHTTSRTLVPYIWSPRHTKQTSVSGSTSNMAKTQRPGSPRRKVRYDLTVNRRPYSASNVTGMWDKSPYATCVAPHLHRPHKIKPRPLSAKVPHYPHKDAQLS
ncbi:unnamed protein product [Candidula unifasciata]|uniref:Thioredoxin domain-containing protein n=1 Tax=Candidula unifasciata TaxID=100452 RepID=A0A8S3ZCN7_9EUPU|nr:unnamed protein product [Candidula unifasciata]